VNCVRVLGKGRECGRDSRSSGVEILRIRYD
jgi:hypothetical protein